MTPVTSAAKMVGQLRRWFTGVDDTADSRQSVEEVFCHCPTCTCNKTQYRERSYSDCYAAQYRCKCQDVTSIRERSCSVNSRQAMSQGLRKHSSRTYQTSSWSSSQQRDVRKVLEEDQELCRCTDEPVCCCERCFLYVDKPSPLLPPPYSELMLQERCAILAQRLNNMEPSIAVSTADVRDQVISTEAAVNFASSLSSAETCQSASGQPVTVVSRNSWSCSVYFVRILINFCQRLPFHSRISTKL